MFKKLILQHIVFLIVISNIISSFIDCVNFIDIGLDIFLSDVFIENLNFLSYF